VGSTVTMTIDWPSKFSGRAGGLYGSLTRQLLSVLGDPDIISFGGGLPAWDLFPLDQIRKVTDEVLSTDGPATLQYSSSEGYRPLREKLVERLRHRGFGVTAENLIIDSGSMQGIDLMAKLFLEKDDAVVVGAPTFHSALQAFSSCQVRFLTVPLDEHGMRVDLLPDILENDQVKFIYVMPTFQNPTGRTMSLERRRALLEVAERYRVPILEDDSYGELRFEGKGLPPLKALDRQDQVVYLGSFSKTLSPGLRVGFMAAPSAMMEKLVFAKQTADLHTSMLPQRIAYEFLRQNLLDPHIEVIIENYRHRRDAMLAAMSQYFPPQVSWNRPEGGIFLWVTLPKVKDETRLFDDGVAEKVVFVPGSCFYAHGGGGNSMRLNFSAYTEEKITLGIQRLARVIERNLVP
jgi:DNA-binding transcriptional MocR family regulator